MSRVGENASASRGRAMQYTDNQVLTFSHLMDFHFLPGILPSLRQFLLPSATWLYKLEYGNKGQCLGYYHIRAGLDQKETSFSVPVYYRFPIEPVIAIRPVHSRSHHRQIQLHLLFTAWFIYFFNAGILTWANSAIIECSGARKTEDNIVQRASGFISVLGSSISPHSTPPERVQLSTDSSPVVSAPLHQSNSLKICL